MNTIEIISRAYLNSMLKADKNSFRWAGQMELEGRLYTVWESRHTHQGYAVREVRTVHMGFNSNEDGKVQEFVTIVEREGACKASWGVTGRTMHMMLAQKLARELPRYEFEIDYDSYGCLARKRKGV